MRILVTGADGLVGRALCALRRPGLVGAGRADGDLTDPAVREALLDRHRPDAVIFCAAFTAVDRAGAPDDEARATAINVEAPGAWARRVPTWWLSSNFVYADGGPHAPDAPLRPLGAYARQKAAGEAAVRAAGGHVCRVGWVYGPGGRTFGSTLVGRLRAGESVAAVADVLVQPTWAADLAESLLTLPEGVSHHMGAEATSWYGFALAVHARVGRGSVRPVRQDALGLAAPRPRDARLDPALLPGWRSRVDALVAAGGGIL